MTGTRTSRSNAGKATAINCRASRETAAGAAERTCLLLLLLLLGLLLLQRLGRHQSLLPGRRQPASQCRRAPSRHRGRSSRRRPAHRKGACRR